MVRYGHSQCRGWSSAAPRQRLAASTATRRVQSPPANRTSGEVERAGRRTGCRSFGARVERHVQHELGGPAARGGPAPGPRRGETAPRAARGRWRRAADGDVRLGDLAVQPQQLRRGPRAAARAGSRRTRRRPGRRPWSRTSSGRARGSPGPPPIVDPAADLQAHAVRDRLQLGGGRPSPAASTPSGRRRAARLVAGPQELGDRRRCRGQVGVAPRSGTARAAACGSRRA